MKCYTKYLKFNTERSRRQFLSLRQDALSGHSFSAPDQRSESGRLRPFLANCPNHEDRLEGPLRAVFRLSQPTFSEATEPRPFWYGCQNLNSSMCRGRAKCVGFEKPPLRRSEHGSNRLVIANRSDEIPRERTPRGRPGLTGAPRAPARHDQHRLIGDARSWPWWPDNAILLPGASLPVTSTIARGQAAPNSFRQLSIARSLLPKQLASGAVNGLECPRAPPQERGTAQSRSGGHCTSLRLLGRTLWTAPTPLRSA
jgi:hypothetical protein